MSEKKTYPNPERAKVELEGLLEEFLALPMYNQVEVLRSWSILREAMAQFDKDWAAVISGGESPSKDLLARSAAREYRLPRTRPAARMRALTQIADFTGMSKGKAAELERELKESRVEIERLKAELRREAEERESAQDHL